MLFKYSKQVVFRANGDFGLGNFKLGNLLKKMLWKMFLLPPSIPPVLRKSYM